ncbi:MAG TPA: AlkA N-terminal domain-containing protein [Caulobacteraceae bacterium]|jgi:AraC family transcriptional regulator of adaptative response / DNA-3-methyladenine glycosylase II
MTLDPDVCYRALSTRDARFDGRLFVGVKTTGIYCRPICPARTPKRENVVFFPSAPAAQEAGFRPCLRCRPESSPDCGAWRGSSNTVARALRLIEAGALDEADVEALAGRVGVGERQLRRLFKTHLGASPIAVAQTRRVLLAKQLIHETRLSMADVALAAGFASVRRFNETFQTLYDRPPIALRRTGAAPSASAGEEVRLTLPYRPPYDWDGLIGFLSMRAIEGVESVRPDRYARSIELDGKSGLLAVSPAPKDRLAVSIHFPRLSALPAILARVRRIFDLSADPQAIGAHLSLDPDLAWRVAARPGLRVPGAWDGFELAVRAILGQQISVGAATTLAGRIVRDHGAPLPETLASVEAGITHIFPPARVLAVADLSSLPMPRARSASIEALAKSSADGAVPWETSSEYAEAVRELRALPGIGEWTAQYIALRALREPDAFPAADIGLQRALADGGGVRPSTAALLARAEAWRPWRAYAALHLWTIPNPETGARHDRAAA